MLGAMKTYDELKAFIASKHNPELAFQPGMVWQVWEDGELTLQKRGELLNQRNLHCIRSGLIVNFGKELMPVQETNHGFAYIDGEETGTAIREAMVKVAKAMLG